MFWLYTSVLRAFRGSPEKKSVSALCLRKWLAIVHRRDVSSHLERQQGAIRRAGVTYVLEIVEEVGDRFALGIGKDIIIVDFRAACMQRFVS